MSSIDEKRIQKAALLYLKQNGPLYRASMDRLNDAFAQDRLELKDGLTKQDAIEAVRLAQAWSYQYLGQERYLSGDDVIDPEAGKAMLEHPGMKSPENIRKVAEIAQVPAFTEAAQKAGIIETMPEAPDTNQRFVEQAQSGNEGFDNRMGYSTDMNIGEGESQGNAMPDTISQSPSGRSYQRVSDRVFRADRKAVVTGTVEMKSDGRGGTYRGRATGTGDSRAEQAIRQRMFSDANGKPVDTSRSTG